MAVYGCIPLQQERDRGYMSFNEFFDFIQESDYEVKRIFENIEMINVLQEDNTSLAIPSKFEYTQDSEKLKTTLIEKVKELYNKFATFVKDLFEKVAKALHEMYMKTNLTDKFISQYKDKVTFKNMVIAREKGWVGIPNSVPLINKLADPSDSHLYKEMNSDLLQFEKDKINVESDIDPIIRAEDYKKASNIYSIFNDKLNKFKSYNSLENENSYRISNNLKSTLGPWANIEDAYLLTTNDKSEDGDHYYPNAELFAKTKSLAENGQALIKKLSQSGKNAVKLLDLDKKVDLNNWKNASKAKTEDETRKITALYYKAKYEYTSAVISRSSQVIKAVTELNRSQHKFAIKAYFEFLKAYNKYCTGKIPTPPKGSDAKDA